MDSKAVLKAVKWPKYTETGLALRKWMDEVEDATPQDVENEPIRLGEAGFGPDGQN